MRFLLDTCQALVHDLILVTVDEAILQYPVATR